MFLSKKEHKTHQPSRLGQWLNRLPAGQKWLYPVYQARTLRLMESTCVSPRLPREMDGLRLAYASDVHYGAYLGKDRVIDLAERLNALQADIILLGGDYGENGDKSLEFFSLLPPLRARAAVCGVVGNHDTAPPWQGQEALVAAMERAGVTPLVNSALDIRLAGARLTLCAVDDIYHGAPDFPGMVRQSAGADFVIFAPHTPDALKEAYASAPEPFFDLALCGHTHGGQLALGGFAPYTASRYGLIYGNRYLSGVRREGRAEVLVSNGVGVSWLPVRVGAPPQYHLITLRRARAR